MARWMLALALALLLSLCPPATSAPLPSTLAPNNAAVQPGFPLDNNNIPNTLLQLQRRDASSCSIDEDWNGSECVPVNCFIKYSFTKNYFNPTSRLCEVKATCSVPYEFDPNTNSCYLASETTTATSTTTPGDGSSTSGSASAATTTAATTTTTLFVLSPSTRDPNINNENPETNRSATTSPVYIGSAVGVSIALLICFLLCCRACCPGLCPCCPRKNANSGGAGGGAGEPPCSCSVVGSVLCCWRFCAGKREPAQPKTPLPAVSTVPSFASSTGSVLVPMFASSTGSTTPLTVPIYPGSAFSTPTPTTVPMFSAASVPGSTTPTVMMMMPTPSPASVGHAPQFVPVPTPALDVSRQSSDTSLTSWKA